jgi:heat shock protein HslJ
LAVVALAVLSAASPAQAAGDRADLFGRGWVSTAVLEDGERLPLFEGAKIRVDFDGGADDNISWRAGCNYLGAHVEITAERLVIGLIEGTDVYCTKPQRRRERWTNRFIRSDPKWRIRRDDRLKLTAGDRVIRLISQRRDR